MSDVKDTRKIVSEYAVEGFRNGLNCTECVLDALKRAGVLNVSGEAMAMCVGFGGGGGLTGHVCGGLSGAIMANGAVYGRANPWSEPEETRGADVADKYYRRYNRMVHRFIEENGSALCGEISAPFGDFHSRERRKNCLKVIAASAVLAYDFLQMDQEAAFALPYGENLLGYE